MVFLIDALGALRGVWVQAPDLRCSFRSWPGPVLMANGASPFQSASFILFLSDISEINTVVFI